MIPILSAFRSFLEVRVLPHRRTTTTAAVPFPHLRLFTVGHQCPFPNVHEICLQSNQNTFMARIITLDFTGSLRNLPKIPITKNFQVKTFIWNFSEGQDPSSSHTNFSLAQNVWVILPSKKLSYIDKRIRGNPPNLNKQNKSENNSKTNNKRAARRWRWLSAAWRDAKRRDTNKRKGTSQ